jgi:ABC-type glutathione transport system ATPase component
MLLDVKDLSIDYLSPNGRQPILCKLNFIINNNSIVGITGESGSGKSMTALSLLGLNNDNLDFDTSGSIFYNGTDLIKCDEKQWARIRNKKISIIFQNPDAALNPVVKCGKQIIEVIKLHQKELESKAAHLRMVELLEKVGFSDTDRISQSFPHELSGGQQQRIVIAIAIANSPEIIIADEATSSLDDESSDEIFDLLIRIKKETGCSIIFITHDIKMLLRHSDRILLIVEGCILANFDNKPNIISNLDSKVKAYITAELPQMNHNNVFTDESNILEVKSLYKSFSTKGLFKVKSENIALNNVSFKLQRGAILGISGKTGSGKSTLAKIISGIVDATSGRIYFNDKQLNRTALRGNVQLRKSIQLIMQDSYTSFDPKQTVREILEEVILFYSLARNKPDVELLVFSSLKEMGLDESLQSRFTVQLSGGQRQRLAIARALLLKPELIIFDESLSALDIRNQIMILDLIHKLKREHNISGLFISHDASLIRYICAESIVIDHGQILYSESTSNLISKEC